MPPKMTPAARRASFLTITLFFLISSCKGKTDMAASQLHHHPAFPSQFVQPRNIDVWLPPGYESETGVRYPVIYMQDGQNLFDSTKAFIGVEWGIDETMEKLIREQTIRKAIVVGIWNTARRFQEYMPQKPLEQRTDLLSDFQAEFGSAPISDRYLQFLLMELKPFIDGRYRTLPDRDHTFILGSSMGGLISIYALCEYPERFAGAACISTHWPIANGVVIDYLRHRLPEPGRHRIYFDFGTETLDAGYESFQKQVDAIMDSLGYRQTKDWITRKFPGHEHSERAWKQRVHIPLTFFLEKT